jgi:hypothetical protein
MTIFGPATELSAGVYCLRTARLEHFAFVVGAEATGETLHCFDKGRQGYVACGEVATPKSAEVPAESRDQQPAVREVSAACSGYEHCMSAGEKAFQSSDWQRAIVSFQSATKANPSAGDAWFRLGNTYLAGGQGQTSINAWDKALDLGSSLSFRMCHIPGFKSCEAGDFSLGKNDLSFAVGGQKQLSLPLSAATVSGTAGALKPKTTLALKVGGKSWDFDVFPFGISCNVGSFLHCPEDGVRQQNVIHDYVVRTITRLASNAPKAATQVAVGGPQLQDLGIRFCCKGMFSG